MSIAVEVCGRHIVPWKSAVDVFRPQLRTFEQPGARDDALSHIDVVSTWKGLNMEQASELQFLQKAMNGALESLTEEALISKFCKEETDPSQLPNYEILLRMEELVNKLQSKRLEFTLENLIDYILWCQEANGRSSTWLLNGKSKRMALANYLRTQECFIQESGPVDMCNVQISFMAYLTHPDAANPADEPADHLQVIAEVEAQPHRLTSKNVRGRPEFSFVEPILQSMYPQYQSHLTVAEKHADYWSVTVTKHFPAGVRFERAFRVRMRDLVGVMGNYPAQHAPKIDTTMLTPPTKSGPHASGHGRWNSEDPSSTIKARKSGRDSVRRPGSSPLRELSSGSPRVQGMSELEQDARIAHQRFYDTYSDVAVHKAEILPKTMFFEYTKPKDPDVRVNMMQEPHFNQKHFGTGGDFENRSKHMPLRPHTQKPRVATPYIEISSRKECEASSAVKYRRASSVSCYERISDKLEVSSYKEYEVSESKYEASTERHDVSSAKKYETWSPAKSESKWPTGLSSFLEMTETSPVSHGMSPDGANPLLNVEMSVGEARMWKKWADQNLSRRNSKEALDLPSRDSEPNTEKARGKQSADTALSHHPDYTPLPSPSPHKPHPLSLHTFRGSSASASAPPTPPPHRVKRKTRHTSSGSYDSCTRPPPDKLTITKNSATRPPTVRTSYDDLSPSECDVDVDADSDIQPLMRFAASYDRDSSPLPATDTDAEDAYPHYVPPPPEYGLPASAPLPPTDSDAASAHSRLSTHARADSFTSVSCASGPATRAEPYLYLPAFPPPIESPFGSSESKPRPQDRAWTSGFTIGKPPTTVRRGRRVRPTEVGRGAYERPLEMLEHGSSVAEAQAAVQRGYEEDLARVGRVTSVASSNERRAYEEIFLGIGNERVSSGSTVEVPTPSSFEVGESGDEEGGGVGVERG